MAKKPIERVAKLRESLERLAQIELGAVQSSMNEAQSSLANLHSVPSSYQTGDTISLSMIELARRASLSTSFAIEHYKIEEEEKLAAYQARRLEKKQIDALLRRRNERESKEALKREQKALDDWTSSRWGRKTDDGK
jgi:flagellar biosynthesis chaperone FliJ